VKTARSALVAALRDVERVSSGLVAREANDRQAKLQKERAEVLIRDGAIARAEFEALDNAAAASVANVDAIRHELAVANQRVIQEQARISAAEKRLSEVLSNAPRQVEARKASVLAKRASVKSAQAALALAELKLSYTRITAPVSGVIASKKVAIGDRVAPGQQVLAIAQIDKLWVTANFRETQLERLRTGQTVEVHVDALDAPLRGTVDSVGGATGARLSLLPPENAAGNYVKVIQRVPVRIHLEPAQPGMGRLRPGMSVEPKVRM
jgi:membrane fusion protein (multidrug efflux system)